MHGDVEDEGLGAKVLGDVARFAALEAGARRSPALVVGLLGGDVGRDVAALRFTGVRIGPSQRRVAKRGLTRKTHIEMPVESQFIT